MTKKTISIEVEYPDCNVCGKMIEENERYTEFSMKASRYNCHRGEYATTGLSLIEPLEIIVCDDCTKKLDDIEGFTKESLTADKFNNQLHTALQKLINAAIKDISKESG